MLQGVAGEAVGDVGMGLLLASHPGAGSTVFTGPVLTAQCPCAGTALLEP